MLFLYKSPSSRTRLCFVTQNLCLVEGHIAVGYRNGCNKKPHEKHSWRQWFVFKGNGVCFFWCIVKKEGVGCCTNEQALGTFVLKSSRLYVLSGERAVSV